MFRPEILADASTPTPASSPATGGEPLDPRRVVRAIVAAKRKLAIVAGVAALGGVLVAKVALPKAYAANATLLWEPPATSHVEGAREIVTLAQSVKLPANLLAVRQKLQRTDRVEAIAKKIDVTYGDNTMLIAVVARDAKADAAADLANTVVEVFLDAQHEVAANRLRESVDALRESLTQSESALGDARTKYDAFRAEHHVDDFSVEVQGAIAELARLRTSAHDAQVELQGIQARESALKAARVANPSSIVISQSEENTDGARLARAETELAALRSKYSEDHPGVLALAAEVSVLKRRAKTLHPAVTAQTTGRNPIYDAIATQAEESRVLRSSLEERAKALSDVQRQVEERATKLTAIQGEAARLLADVSTNEEHVNVLLKQLAMAEDDVRGATSGFQLVSRATPPDHAERGFGRIVAVILPLLSLLIAAIAIVARELRGLKVKTTSEAAYWGRAPVLASTSWPRDEAEPIETASRYAADALEARRGVVGLAAMKGAVGIAALGHAIADRLHRRGKRCAILEAREHGCSGASGQALADALEHRAFAARVATLRATHDLVIVLSPPAAQPMALRAAIRCFDALVLVLDSGEASVSEIAPIGRALGLDARGLGIVLTNVPRDLVSWSRRAAGDAMQVWRATQGAS